MHENMKHADESIDVTSASCVHFIYFVLIMHEDIFTATFRYVYNISP